MDQHEKHTSLSLLLVDDDEELCAMMTEFVTQAGHRLDFVHNGRDGLSTALSGTHDLVILDVMLPILNGFEVLQQLRRRKTVPVIMLTARVEAQDRILGLNTGADDYLPKPFDPDELLARVRAVLRRTEFVPSTQSSERTVGSIRLNAATREAWSEVWSETGSETGHSSAPLQLTGMEFDLLEMLMRSAGRAVSREEITAALFEREATPYDRFLDVHISHLRKKLPNGQNLIRTVRGVGYMFTGVE
jgi:two-component system response regulator CpxR